MPGERISPPLQAVLPGRRRSSRRRKAEFAPLERSRTTSSFVTKREELRREGAIVEKLHGQLAKLTSLVLPVRGVRQFSEGSIVADALKYKRTLRKEIEILEEVLTGQLAAQRQAQRQVEVNFRDGCMQIQIHCENKTGLLIVLMEAMESVGLVFSKVSISCRESIIIDALSTQSSGLLMDIKLVKKVFIDTIVGYANSNSTTCVE